MDEGGKELLKEARIARLATISSLGDPIAVPVRFHFDGSAIYFTSPEEAPHIRNLRGNRRVCVLVERVGGESHTGLVIQGLAQFVKGESERKAVLEALEERYGSPPEGTVVKVLPVRVLELEGLG